MDELINVIFTVEKFSRQRAKRNLANLQVHQASEAHQPGSSPSPSTKVPYGHLQSAKSKDGSAEVAGKCEHNDRHGQGI